MILIKSIEVAVVEGDLQSVIGRFQKQRADSLKTLILVENVALTEEMVYGRIYRTADGREIVIGMTKEVKDAIGLPYGVFENLTKELTAANNHYKAYRNWVVNMPWWERLKGLFVGFL